MFPDVVYVATPAHLVDVLLEAAGVTAADVVYDLGCGDGRLVVAAAARFGARAVGIDIDPVRIAEAEENVREAGVGDRVTIRHADMFTCDLSEATVVTLYLLPSANLRLRPRLQRELRPGARVVSQLFDMDDWAPDHRLEVEGRIVNVWTIGGR